MKSTVASAAAAIVAFASTAQATVQGFDISHYQASVDYAGAHSAGARFVIIKVRHTGNMMGAQD